MKVKLFLNSTTGEIVQAKNKLHAYKIFKADGKKCHYKTPLNKIVLWLSVRTSREAFERMTETLAGMADGIPSAQTERGEIPFPSKRKMI